MKGDTALIDSLGIVGFAKYMEFFDNGGSGDYTEERHELPFMNMSIDEICELKTNF